MMQISYQKISIYLIHVFFVFLLLSSAACNRSSTNEQESEQIEDPRKPSLKPLLGIDFFEVKRSFDNGISWDSIGFVQIPEWHMQFAKEDSILIYSPPEDAMLGFRVYHDHDSFFHFARGSWKIIEIHPDSVLIQRLNLNGLKVDKIRSNIYMKFYSKSYLENNFQKQSLEVLRQPKAIDSSFVKAMVERANRNPTNMDSAFASIHFAKIKSKNPNLTLKKKKIENIELTGQTPSYEYLYPEYYLKLQNAYKNFNHDFSVIIDQHGEMHLGKVYVQEEFLEQRTKVVQGIIDVYLKNLLEVEPAETMGMKHSSVVYFYMSGKQAK